MKEHIKAVIFDMDGVLIDSESVCDEIWYRLAEEMNMPDIHAAIEENRGCNVELMERQLQARYGSGFNCKKFFDDFGVYFREVEFSRGIPLLPEVKETLDFLKDAGYRLGLATSTARHVATRQLKAVGIYDYFDAWTFGDEITHSKPAPDIYLKAAQELGVEPEFCVGVEDSPNGIKSCKAAGFKPVMVPDRIAPSDEMAKLCWKIGKPVSILKEIL